MPLASKPMAFFQTLSKRSERFFLGCLLHRVDAWGRSYILFLLEYFELTWLFNVAISIIIGIDVSRFIKRIQFYRCYFFILYKSFDHLVFILAPNLCRNSFYFFSTILIGPLKNDRHDQSTFIAESDLVHIFISILALAFLV